jgi:mannose/fructose/N-acetylgalactosamine-specific phosphotransferase system component IIC
MWLRSRLSATPEAIFAMVLAVAGAITNRSDHRAKVNMAVPVAVFGIEKIDQNRIFGECG